MSPSAFKRPDVQVKDPHVFPYIIKGYKESYPLRLESRRNQTEAEQTADVFRSEGYSVTIFLTSEVKPT
jgi:hypothetical protein